jgi:molecular chaperone GrpE
VSAPAERTGIDPEPLEQGIGALRDEVAMLRDLFQRRLFEDRARQQLYDDLRDQLDFARAGLAGSVVGPLVQELLLVVDRIAAMGAVGIEDAAEAVESVRVELLEIAARRGVRRLPAAGAPFDPAVHEAVGRSFVPDEFVGIVVEEVRPGFTMGDAVLRPARVTVGVAATGEVPPAG